MPLASGSRDPLSLRFPGCSILTRIVVDVLVIQLVYTVVWIGARGSCDQMPQSCRCQGSSSPTNPRGSVAPVEAGPTFRL